MYRVRAFMPPQGLLLIAAYLPASWPVRFIDENIAPATADDFAWADILMVSGMHIQAPQMHDIAARARAAGRVTVLGGASVSGAPELYPEYDYLHIGEIGDATFANRMITPARGKLTFPNLRAALVLAFNILLCVGILSDYRRPFWRAVRHAFHRGQIDAALGIGFVAYYRVLARGVARRPERFVLFDAQA